jgi:homeobox protein cut-like
LAHRYTPVEADNVFQTALSKWRDIDFAALQTQLDKQGSDIVEAQKDFLVERKELSTKTKMFRKLPDDEKLLQVMSLFKGTSPIHLLGITALLYRS